MKDKMVWDFGKNNFELRLFEILTLTLFSGVVWAPHTSIFSLHNNRISNDLNFIIICAKIPMLHYHKVVDLPFQKKQKKTWSENFAIIALQIPIKSP